MDGVKKTNEFSLSELVWRQPTNIRIRRQKRPKRLITHIKRRNKRTLVNSFLEKYESFLLYLHIYNIHIMNYTELHISDMAFFMKMPVR